MFSFAFVLILLSSFPFIYIWFCNDYISNERQTGPALGTSPQGHCLGLQIFSPIIEPQNLYGYFQAAPFCPRIPVLPQPTSNVTRITPLLSDVPKILLNSRTGWIRLYESKMPHRPTSTSTAAINLSSSSLAWPSSLLHSIATECYFCFWEALLFFFCFHLLRPSVSRDLTLEVAVLPVVFDRNQICELKWANFIFSPLVSPLKILAWTQTQDFLKLSSTRDSVHKIS